MWLLAALAVLALLSVLAWNWKRLPIVHHLLVPIAVDRGVCIAPPNGVDQRSPAFKHANSLVAITWRESLSWICGISKGLLREAVFRGNPMLRFSTSPPQPSAPPDSGVNRRARGWFKYHGSRPGVVRARRVSRAGLLPRFPGRPRRRPQTVCGAV